MSTSSVRAGQAYIELTTQDAKLRKGLLNATAQLKAFSANATAIGSSLVTLGGAAAAPLALAVKAFADFDSQMRKVRAVTQASEQDFERLKAKAREIGAGTAYSAREVADAMTALGRAGFDPTAIQSSIGSVMALARATDTELATAADIAVNSLNMFGGKASDAAHYADVLTATANGSAQTLVDLFEALKVAGPQAKQSGERIEDLCAALGVLANMGIKGSLAGTALRKAYTQFANPKIIAFLDGYNVKTTDAQGNLRKMRDIMVDLARAMSTMSTAEKTAFAKEVFDTRGMTAGLSLTVDTSKIDEFLAQLEKCDGIAKKTQNDIEKGLRGAFSKFSSAAQEVGLVIGETLAPALISLTNAFAESLQALGKWCKENKTTIEVLAAVLAVTVALGGAMLAIGAAAKLLSIATVGATVVLKAFHGISMLVTGLRVTYTACMAAMSAATAAYTAATAAGTGAVGAFSAALTAFFATNPVGWFLLAAGACAALVYALNGYSSAQQQVIANADQIAARNVDQRQQDQQKIARLQELSQKYSLTNDEMKEARSLAAKLTAQYGDLGIKFDNFAGRVLGVAQAFERLNDAQRLQQIADIDRQIAEQYRLIEQTKGYNEEFNSFWTKLNHPIDWATGQFGVKIRMNEDYINFREVDIARLQKQRAALIAQMNKPAAPAPEPKPAPDGGNRISGQDFLAAQKASDKMEAKIPRTEETTTARRIAKLREERDEYLRLLEVQKKYYAQQGMSTQENDIAAKIQSAQAAYDAEIARLQKQEKDKAAAADKRALDKIAGMDQSFAQARAQRAERAQQAADARGLKNALALDPGATVSALRRLIGQFDRAAEEAVKRYEQARKEAVKPDADGRVRITGEELRAMQAARANYDRSQAAAERYRNMLRSVQETVRSQSGAFGSFSVGDLLNLAGGGSAAERTAKATEIQNRLAETTNRLLGQIAKQKETW